MAWKPTGRPTVRQQRDKWVVRVDGIDTETGKRRPRQLGTYTSRRAAQAAASAFAAAGDVGSERDTVGSAGRASGWPAGSTSPRRPGCSTSGRPGTSAPGSVAIRLDRLDRERRRALARRARRRRASSAGAASQIFRMVLRAALADAVEDRRAPPEPRRPGRHARVGGEARPSSERSTAWTEDRRAAVPRRDRGPPLGAPLRLAVLYGLRRSELLGLRWSAVDLKTGHGAHRAGLVEVHGRPEWSEGKNARSRRTIPIDPSMAKALADHRRFQAEERLAAGAAWNDNDLVVATRHGHAGVARQLRPDARAARRKRPACRG